MLRKKLQRALIGLCGKKFNDSKGHLLEQKSVHWHIKKSYDKYP